MRSYAGAFFALYLAAWTQRWAGGPLPAHVVGLDVALTAAVILAVWKLRTRAMLAPLAAIYGHLILQANLVRGPTSALEWGATFVTVGFALLAGSIATSYRLRPPVLGASPPPEGFYPDHRRSPDS